MSEPKEGERRPVTREEFSSLVDYTVSCRALVEYLFLLAEEGRFMPTGEERFKELDQIFEDTRGAWVEGVVHGPGQAA